MSAIVLQNNSCMSVQEDESSGPDEDDEHDKDNEHIPPVIMKGASRRITL